MDRDHILAEIKRTAEENGGRPLGQKRFSNETGVRDGDWLGKYWARWGDAVREAGFEPNTLQQPFGREFLLKHYAKLARELGRLPVKAELQLKASRDPGFPSHNTFARFGGKRALASSLSEFCRGRTDYADVLALCPTTEPSVARSAKPGKAPVLGYVYLLKSGRHFKIGRTNAVGRRERELAIQLPQKADVVHKIATDDPVGIENYWHRRFEAKRGNGEWFDLSPEDVAAFRRRKSM